MFRRSGVGTQTRVLENRLLEYVGPKGEPCACRVRLFQTGNEYVLVATDNGTGITRTIDRIATVMVRRWEIEPNCLLVVEHYDYQFAHRAPGEPEETFAYVGFDWNKCTAHDPTWCTATRSEVSRLIGGMDLQ